MLRLFVENGLNQVGGFDADLKQIGDQPANAGKRARRGAPRPFEDFLHPGAEPFVAADELVEHGSPLGNRAASLLEADELLAADLVGRAEPGDAGLGGGGLPLPVLGRHLQFRAPRQQRLELGAEPAPRVRQLGQPPIAPPPRLGRGGDPAFQPADLVAQGGRRADLFHQQPAALLRLAADLVEPRVELGQPAFALGELPGDRAVPLFGLIHLAARFGELLPEIAGADAHRGQLPAMRGDFLLQVAGSLALVVDGRLLGDDPLAVVARPRFGPADFVVDRGGPAFRLDELRLGPLGLGGGRAALVRQGGNLRLVDGELLSQLPPIDQADLGPQSCRRVVCSR